MLTKKTVALVGLALACVPDHAVQMEPPASGLVRMVGGAQRLAGAPALEATALGPLRLALLTSFQAPPAPARETSVQPDGYAGWENWCEPTWYEGECQTDEDCRGKSHAAHRGAPFRCLHPWWAESDELRICAPAGASKTERRWRYARLRELVSQLYYDEAEHCEWEWEMEAKPKRPRKFHRRWADGKQMHHQGWRCQREWAKAERLTNFLWVPYKRETSGRPFKRHRLNPDETANKKAYVREASVYGWTVELACEVEGRSVGRCPRFRSGPMKGKKRVYIKDAYPDPEAERHNPYYGDRYRWEYGLGPVGKNTAYGVQDWEVMAPPEVLCLEVPGIEAYMRDVRGAVRLYRGTRPPVCGGEPYRGKAIRRYEDKETGEIAEVVVAEPSWFDVHRVASAGSWCPKKGKKAAKLRRNFRAQMESRGVDPDQPVTEEMFGRPLARKGQWARAQEVLAHLEAVLPPPWEPDPAVKTE